MHREINNLNFLRHKNIVCLHDVVYGRTSTHLVMELCGVKIHSKLLKDYVIDEYITNIIYGQLLSAVAYMHEQNFAHRDLKLKNVLIDKDNNVKLVNFGQAVRFPKDENRINRRECLSSRMVVS